MTNETSNTEDSIGLQVTVCENGVINVKRPSSDKAHSVFTDGQNVLRCSCKGHKYHGYCCHEDLIEARPLVLSSASCASQTPRVATDGGTESDETPETCDRCPTLLADVHATHEATTVTTDGEELCPECDDARSGEEIGFVTDDDEATERERPTRSEPADFGGGEGGMDEL